MEWLTILACVLLIEGIGPLLFPNKWQGYLKQIAEMEASQLRTVGGVLFVIAIFLLWVGG